ncbi:MAG: hypothetical protein ACXADW_02850 [Candidatus Hodarchaeales archaeon]
MAEEKEKNEQQSIEDERNQRVVDEVTQVRRKGKKASEKLRQESPQKWSDYNKAMKKGHRAKRKKK